MPPHRISKLNLVEMKDQSIVEIIFGVLALLLLVVCPLLLCCAIAVSANYKRKYKTIHQYDRGIVLRFGKVKRGCPLQPGLTFLTPCVDELIRVDIRTQTINLPPQEVLTKDSVTVSVEAVVYYHVTKPLEALLNVECYDTATELISIAILRNILGQYPLSELLSSRAIISNKTKSQTDKATAKWGVVVERVEIKDVSLPLDLQKAMAAEAEGTRIAKAKIIEAEGEIKTAENLKEASLVMMKNPQIILLRYLQTLNYIAAQQKTSILFPFPIDIPEPK